MRTLWYDVTACIPDAGRILWDCGVVAGERLVVRRRGSGDAAIVAALPRDRPLSAEVFVQVPFSCTTLLLSDASPFTARLLKVAVSK